jgi:hypothetical protein
MKKNFLLIVKLRLLSWLSPEPEIQSEYSDKVVMLLRRDFNTKQQNEIVLDILKKLKYEREKDMTKMSEEYSVLQKDTLDLNTHILC